MKAIINGYIHTCENVDIPNGYVAFECGNITSVGNMDDFNIIKHQINDVLIDVYGNHVCAGFVESHSHIGIWEDSMDFEGADGNEDTDPITPHLRAIDAINPLDRCFADAYKAGITTVVTGPGSANVIGGQFAAMKTYGKSVDQMILKSPVAMKFALGENPKSTYHSKNQTPVTRMGTAALLRETLLKAKEYLADLENYESDKEKFEKPEFDFKLHALLPVLRREIPAKVHAHRSDDIMTAYRIAHEFDIDITIEHATDGAIISDLLKQENAKLMVGPALCDRCKIELRESGFENYKVLSDAGLDVAIITDHPVVPIEYLPLLASIAVKNGMDKNLALKAITITAAKNCNIDDKVGSLTVGKNADIIVLDGHPIDFNAKVLYTIIDGNFIYKQS